MEKSLFHHLRPVCKHTMQACFETIVDCNPSQLTESEAKFAFRLDKGFISN